MIVASSRRSRRRQLAFDELGGVDQRNAKLDAESLSVDSKDGKVTIAFSSRTDGEAGGGGADEGVRAAASARSFAVHAADRLRRRCPSGGWAAAS